MPVIWLVAVVASALAALVDRACCRCAPAGVYFIMITLAFGQMFYYFAISWPAYGGEDGLSIYVRNGFPGLNTLDPIQFFGSAVRAPLLAALLWLYARLRALALRAGAERRAPERRAGRGRGARPDAAAAGRLRDLGRDHRAGRGVVRRSQPLRQPDDVQLADLSGEIMSSSSSAGSARLFGPVAGAALFVDAGTWLGGLSEYWQIYPGR